MAIGQSTPATRRVIGNLFYRGLCFQRFPCIGDTLRTKTTVVGLRAAGAKPRLPSAGLVALHVVTVDQRVAAVLDFWR